MTFKSPTAALNEVLLAAAIRAERINTERLSEERSRYLARRNDILTVTHRVPVSSQTERNADEHSDDRRQQPA
jgi:hypothetical protein